MIHQLQLASFRRAAHVWLALLLAVFAALAPTVSHALAASRGDAGTLTEICSSTGSRWVSVNQADANSSSTDSSNGQESAISLTHCPFCLLSTDRVAPAPHPLVHLFAVFGDNPEPTVLQAFFYFEHFPWGPPPRGPPAHS